MKFLNDISVSNNITATGTIQSANLTLTGLSTGSYVSTLVENAGVVYKRDLTLSLLPTGTEGQMLYNNAGTWTAFSGVFWDNTNSRLGVGLTSSLTAKLTARGAGTTSSSYTFQAEDSAGLEIVRIRDDGLVSIRQRLPHATYGSELVTNGTFNTDLSGWTVGGADWSWVGGAATHAATGATTLRQLTVSTAAHYRVKFTIIKTSGTSITAAFGGVTLVIQTANSTGSYVYDVLTTATTGFVFTPTSNFVGSVDTVSATLYTTNPTPALTIYDSTGSVAAEFRASATSFNFSAGLNSLQRADVVSTHNTCVGSQTMAGSYYALYNTCVGALAGQSLNNATSNVVIGYSAAQNMTAGSANVAIGYSAMLSTTTASNNIAVGYNALRSAGTSSGSVGIGTNALYSNTTSANTAVGNTAGYSNAGGGQNTLIGASAGYSNVSGGNNAVLGAYGLYYPNATSAANVAIGVQSLYGTSANAVSNNTAVGYRTGYVVTTGSNNVLIGYQAGDALTSGSNNIVIGYDVDAQSASTSNQLTIGNALFGVVIDGTNTTISTGRLGAFVAAPTARFHLVAGAATANNAPLKFTAGTNLSTAEAGAMEWDGTNLFITQTTGPTRKTIAYTDSVSTLTVTDDTTTNATMYPTWVTANTGNLPLKVSSTKFSFNPSTGNVTLAGALSAASATLTGASGLTVNGGPTTLKAAAFGSVAGFFAVFTGDPSTSGQAINTRTAAQVRSDISAATSGAITSSGLTMSTARMLGRTTAATGAIEEISLANGTNCAATLSAGVLTVAISSTPTFTDCTVTGRMNLPTSQPASPVNGSCYWDGSTNKFWVYSSTYGWKSVTLT